MRTYEVLFILAPSLGEEESTNLITEFRGVAEKGGAKLISEDAWGRRRLAYPINKVSEGIYHLFTFEGEGEFLSEVDRKMKNSDQIIRHMITRTDLDLKRAAKLAKRNPKKERVRPAPAEFTQATPTSPAAPAAPAETPAPAAE